MAAQLVCLLEERAAAPVHQEGRCKMARIKRRRLLVLSGLLLVVACADLCQASSPAGQGSSGQQPTTLKALTTTRQSSAKLVTSSETGGSQQRRPAAKMERRDGNMPELTIEDEAGDAYLSTEETYESGQPTGSTLMTSTEAEGHSSSFGPDYDGSEGSGETVLEMTAPPAAGRPMLQMGGGGGGGGRPMRQSPQQHQQPRAAPTPPPLVRANPNLSFHQPTLRAAMGPAQTAISQMPSLGRPNQQPAPSNQLFNVNMGPDRLMIKHRGQHSGSDQQELATESINHELLHRAVVGHQHNGHNQHHLHHQGHAGAAAAGASQHQEADQERRHQELLYPMATSDLHLQHQHHQMAPPALDGMQATLGSSTSAATICYTPLGLLLVIGSTMLVTALVCFATHYLLKQLGRRQFDLIANSKHFDTKHRSGGGQLEALDRRHFMSLAANRCAAAAAADLEQQQQLEAAAKHGCAFDNPYFRDEPSSLGPATTLRHSAKSLARAPTSTGDNNNQESSPGQLRNSEQLNFIEHHISNLHSRQVTSSVKELSVLGSPSPRVVDLTSEEQRARVIADPKEGDLVAVDISGHDFIGLGFDLCGGPQEGIFVRSVLSRGPARESGCIHPGDRLKCLNVSFDQMTLQDATDLLNCGSPYKLRLLLEKRPASGSQTATLGGKAAADKLRQPAPILLRRNHRYYAGNAGQQQYLSQSYLLGEHLATARSNSGGYQPGGGGLFKACLRRLASLVAPAGPPPSYYGGGGGGQRTSDQLEPPPQHYLGSLAARRHLLQGRAGTLPTGGPQALHLVGGAHHLNSGYASDDLDLHQQQVDFVSHHHQQQARRRSVGSLQAAHQHHQHQHLFGASSGDLLADSSLDNYQQRNAHHRLHGPQLGPSGQLFDPSRATPHREGGGGGGLAEQSQSQPEIAAGNHQQQAYQQQHQHQQRQAAHQPNQQLAPANSAPAMQHLYTGNGQTDWRGTQTRRSGGGDAKAALKDEPGSSESSFADSTSKLVAGGAAATDAGEQAPEAAAKDTAGKTAPTANSKAGNSKKLKGRDGGEPGNSRA